MNQILPAHALTYTLQKALQTFDWLVELEDNLSKIKPQDIALLKEREGVLIDALVTYISSLVDQRSGTHSLINSFQPHALVHKFENLSAVKACVLHRNNRFGHQSKNFGFFVSLNDILQPELREYLSSLYTFICIKEIIPK